MLRRVQLVALALAAGTAALSFAPSFETEWHIFRGNIGFYTRDFRRAVEHLVPAVDSLAQRGDDKNSADYRRRVAQSYLALNEDDNALVHFRWLAKSRWEDSKSHVAVGLHAVKIGDFDEGIRHLKRAADLDAACTICRAAHVNAEAAKAANLRSLQARQDQEKLLELMRPPALCLCFLAVLTGISASGGALHSQLVSIIHKLGATKKLADTAVRALEKVVRFLPDAFNLHPEEVHPNRCVNPAPPFGLDRSDIAKFMWEWKGVLPYMDIAERAYAAYPHVETLAGLTASFGSAYGAESTSNGQLDAAQALLAEHWHRLAAASTDPFFIDRGMSGVAINHAPIVQKGLFRNFLGKVNPFNWF